MTKFVAPMLVSEIPGYRSMILGKQYIYIQPKLNGWCCMANTRTRKLYTRTGREIHTVPHINAALPVDGPEWIHGELYVHSYTLTDIAKLIRRGSDKIALHVFDCVSREDYSTRLASILKIETSDAIKTVPTIYTEASCAEIYETYHTCLKKGYEGIIIRLDGYGYEHKRSIRVFKMKPSTEKI